MHFGRSYLSGCVVETREVLLNARSGWAARRAPGDCAPSVRVGEPLAVNITLHPRGSRQLLVVDACLEGGHSHRLRHLHDLDLADVLLVLLAGCGASFERGVRDVVERAQADEDVPELVAVHLPKLVRVEHKGEDGLADVSYRKAGAFAKGDPCGAVVLRVSPEIARLELDDVLVEEALLKCERLGVEPCERRDDGLAGDRDAVTFREESACTKLSYPRLQVAPFTVSVSHLPIADPRDNDRVLVFHRILVSHGEDAIAQVIFRDVRARTCRTLPLAECGGVRASVFVFSPKEVSKSKGEPPSVMEER